MYIRNVVLAQYDPEQFFTPRFKDGFWQLGFFHMLSFVLPNSARSEYTLLTAMRYKERYEANKSSANHKAYWHSRYTHNLLAVGRKYEFDSDCYCCARHPNGWGSCQYEKITTQYLVTINDEFGAEVTPLVPIDCADPYDQYKDILALLYRCRSQTQHTGDHECIDSEIKTYTLLAGQPVVARPLPTSGDRR